MSLTSWFRNLPRGERRGLLGLLHTMRTLIGNEGNQSTATVENYLALMEKLEGVNATAPEKPESTEPIAATLYCPLCGLPHIESDGYDRIPHHWHRCSLCGQEFRLHGLYYGAPPSEERRPRMMTRLLRDARTEILETMRRTSARSREREEVLRRIDDILLKRGDSMLALPWRGDKPRVDHLMAIEIASDRIAAVVSGASFQDDRARHEVSAALSMIRNAVLMAKEERAT